MIRTKGFWAAALGVVALVIAGWLVFSGRGGDGAGGDTPRPPNVATSGEIPLTADQVAALSLRFAAAEPALVEPVAALPAQIAPPPNARVAVAAQLPGIVTRIHVVEGDVVRAGQTLATVSSRDMVSLGSDLARARARLAVARASADRIGQLNREGIVAAARLDEARATLREAEIDVQEHARLVGMANGAAGGSYALIAPIGGRVSAMTIETGKALDPGAAPFVIDGAGPLQAQVQLPHRLIGRVHPGMRVIAASGLEGQVVAVGTTLDPQTRSAMLTAHFPDATGLRSGQSLILSVLGPAPDGAVRVPATAIARLGDDTLAFVRTKGGVAVRPVQLGEGGGTDGVQVVLSGLKPGEQVAVSAVSELKSLAAAD
ncbi:efflux RND transporter periplasmic adaptor subunit [Sphingomonas flavalba]|uniref:efflux RND transporter periplasmic adaptor subunit n=1 Tax=Sphingomonas flavalba TaxID=2559804 RepID=UPI0039E002C0